VTIQVKATKQHFPAVLFVGEKLLQNNFWYFCYHLDLSDLPEKLADLPSGLFSLAPLYE